MKQTVLASAATCILLVGCGGDAPQEAGFSEPPTTASAATEPDEAESQEPAAEPTEYHSTVFDPAFTVTLPSDWTVAERAEDVTQIYQPCDECPHNGQANGELTMDMTLADVPPEEAIKRLEDTENLASGGAQEVTLGELSGYHFTGTRTGTAAEITFRDSGYRSGASGEPIEVYALQVGDRTLTLFIDPHESRGADAVALTQTAREIAEALRFTP